MARPLKMKKCTIEQLVKFVNAYPRPLDRHVTMICDPPLVGYYDFALGDKGDESTRVASYFHDRDDKFLEIQRVAKVPPPRKGWKPPPTEAEVAARLERERQARVKAYLDKNPHLKPQP